ADLCQVLGTHHIGNDRAAERHDDFRSRFLDERPHDADGAVEYFLPALRDVGPIDADRSDIADEPIKAECAHDAPRIWHVRRQRHCDAYTIGQRQSRVDRGAAKPDDRNIDRKTPTVDAWIERIRRNDGMVTV